MKDECCHQHPDNGSDLALQTESQRAETDLRAVNAKLLAALEGLAGAFRDNPNKPRNSKDWEYMIETDVFAAAIPQARAAILEAKK
jgi:hypothetical protein